VLCQTLLHNIGDELGRPGLLISEDAMHALQRQAWPGNVRQLKNALERAVVMTDSRILEPASFLLSAEISAPVADIVGEFADNSSQFGLSVALENLEKKMIAAALIESGGVKSRAAEILQIPRTQLLYRMKRLGVVEN